VTAVAPPEPERLERVVVVGASLAGLRACETLRTEGYRGAITLIGDEEHLPYDRPPLSKKLLAGEWEPDRIVLRKPEAIDELGLDLRLGRRAAGLDLDARSVTLADGSSVPFDGLVLATGSRTRRLPGQDAVPEVRELRTLDDSLALRELISDGTASVVVIGAGFIGLEVAATARARGCSVTVLEAAEAPLIRGLGVEMGRATTSIHDGIPIRCGVSVEELRADGVRLAGGEWVPADVIVVGIGVTPATDWLVGSGLELGDGVVCDPTLRAGVPGVYAAGDLARWPNELFAEEMRVEHWTNAAEQGAAAARNLLAVAAGGAPAAYAPVPFFWSDQVPHRIQFLGRGGADDDVEAVVVVGTPESGRFLALFGRRGRLWGALGVNVPRLVMPYRTLLATAATWDDALKLASEQRHTQQS
jgi:NADPH-dependent 2,4-dienoyl-CoA reductase/sulfur reductase-like enzyme